MLPCILTISLITFKICIPLKSSPRVFEPPPCHGEVQWVVGVWGGVGLSSRMRLWVATVVNMFLF